MFEHIFEYVTHAIKMSAIAHHMLLLTRLLLLLLLLLLILLLLLLLLLIMLLLLHPILALVMVLLLALSLVFCYCFCSSNLLKLFACAERAKRSERPYTKTEPLETISSSHLLI